MHAVRPNRVAPAMTAAATAKRRGSTKSRGRHCPDCGAAMVYYPHLSRTKAPDGRRILAYSCPECTDDFERPRMVVVRRAGGGTGAGAGKGDGDGIETVDVEIIERGRPPGTGAARPGAGRAPEDRGRGQ